MKKMLILKEGCASSRGHTGAAQPPEFHRLRIKVKHELINFKSLDAFGMCECQASHILNKPSVVEMTRQKHPHVVPHVGAGQLWSNSC